MLPISSVLVRSLEDRARGGLGRGQEPTAWAHPVGSWLCRGPPTANMSRLPKHLLCVRRRVKRAFTRTGVNMWTWDAALGPITGWQRHTASVLQEEGTLPQHITVTLMSP